MSKSTISRQAVWAKQKRAHLMEVLGPICRHCGSTESLTFDCIKPQGGAHHKFSSVRRMSFYTAQFRAGNLQVLCAACNIRKGGSPNDRYRNVVTGDRELRSEWNEFRLRKRTLSNHIYKAQEGGASHAADA